jgi:predicted transcriptional regulator
MDSAGISQLAVVDQGQIIGTISQSDVALGIHLQELTMAGARRALGRATLRRGETPA